MHPKDSLFMNQYLFYTAEGFTQSPNGEACENMQVLGTAKGIDSVDAMYNLLAENEWIEASGFSKEEVKCVQLLTDVNRADVSTVVEFMRKNMLECPKELAFAWQRLRKL